MKHIFSAVMDTVWLVCLYFGLVHQVEGALNIGLFLVGVMFVFSFFLLSPDIEKAISKTPAWAMARSVAFDLAALGLLLWHGWIWTAIALAWSATIAFGSWSKNRVRREA